MSVDFGALKGLFNKSKELSASDLSNNQELPEGKYVATVHGLELTVSQSTKKNMAKWEFIVNEDEEFGGKHHWRYDVLDDEKKMKRFLLDLEKFGYDTDDLEFEDLEAIFEDIEGEECALVIKEGKPNKEGTTRFWTTITMDLDEEDEEYEEESDEEDYEDEDEE